MKKSQFFKAGTASFALGLALISAPAFAQDAAQTEEAVDKGEEIVVTGTLITNPNLKQSAPVNVTTAEELQLRQTNVAEQILREIPGIVPSIGSAVNNGNGGASYVNLRGLGSNRNIVLLDGNRIVPADLSGRTDLNNIPLALVDRMDVLTGGASTTYGADAVSGVVNFITKRDFAGVEAAAGYQITDQGDGHVFRVDVTTGANFDDGRGNVVLGVGYQEAAPVYQGARDFSVNNVDSFSGRTSGSGTAVPARFSLPGAGARQVNADGTALVPTYAPFNFNPYNIFQTPFKRYNMYAAGRYEVSDAVELYTRGMFSKNRVSTIIAPSGIFGVAVQIPLSNPFLTAGLRDQFCVANGISAAECAAAALATSPTAPGYREVTSSMFRRAVENGPRISEYNTTMFDYKLGARGGITDTINWDLFGSYGESENTQIIKGYTLNSRWRQAIRATSTTQCLDTSNGCVPVNPFGGAGSITPAMAAFLSQNSSSVTKTSLSQARGTVSGDFGWQMPWSQNPVGFAVGTEYRKYNAMQDSDALAKGGDLGGAGGATPYVNGSYNVYEFFGELIAPLIEDKPFFEQLTLEAGIRNSHYSIDTPGNPKFSTTTWKAGGSWTPGAGFKIRGNYAHAVRSPNISELFSPQNTGLTNLSNDPCATFDDNGVRIRPNPTGALRDVCLAQLPASARGQIDAIQQPTAGQANSTGGGNPLLKPEVSNSWTLGFVWAPDFLRGFNMSVDYYNIKIKKAVTSPTPSDVVNACFNSVGTSNPFCGVSYFGRDPLTGQLSGDPNTTTGLYAPLSNLGYLKTDGVDFTLNYKYDLDFADLGFGLAGNWTNSSVFNSNPAAGAASLDCVGLYSENCGSIQPEWMWSARTTVGLDKVDISLLWRHISSVKYEFANDAFVGTPQTFTGNYDFNKIKAYDWFDLTTRFNVNENLALTMTVQNLFDKKPPLVGSNIGSTAYNSGNTYPSTYDALGRRYGVEARLKF